MSLQRRHAQRGNFGMIVLLIALLIVAYLMIKNANVFMPTSATVKMPAVPQDMPPGMIPAPTDDDPSTPAPNVIQKFKDDAKNIEKQIQK